MALFNQYVLLPVYDSILIFRIFLFTYLTQTFDAAQVLHRVINHGVRLGLLDLELLVGLHAPVGPENLTARRSAPSIHAHLR